MVHYNDYTCWYVARFYKRCYYPSVFYRYKSNSSILYGRLGDNLSNSCVRLAQNSADWLYDNIKSDTIIVVY